MKGIPQGRYTREFRQEAVKLVIEEGLSLPEAGRRLSLAPSTLAYWAKAYKSGKLGEIGKAQKPLTEVEMELARTTKELVEVKMEWDILKKQPRTLPRSRSAVRGDEVLTSRIRFEYQGLLRQFGLEVSMSRCGNCFDNAPMESFWGIIKQELINHRHYRTRREAIEDITEYIEVFYNRQRLQAKLGYLSPVAYARKYYAGLVAA